MELEVNHSQRRSFTLIELQSACYALLLRDLGPELRSDLSRQFRKEKAQTKRGATNQPSGDYSFRIQLVCALHSWGKGHAW